MKKTFAKILAIALCAVLLVTGSVFITLAYLQSQSNTVQNTFTVSTISLELKESKVNLDGTRVEGADKVEANQYKLTPGSSYIKDPTVYVAAGSEPCYIVIAIRDTLFNGENDNQELYNGRYIYGEDGQMAAKGWVELPDYHISAEYLTGTVMADWVVDGNHGYKLYYYNTAVTAGQEGTALPIFEGFTLSGDITGNALTALDGATFELVAFGMQTTGYEGIEDTAAVADKIDDIFDATFGDPA